MDSTLAMLIFTSTIMFSIANLQLEILAFLFLNRGLRHRGRLQLLRVIGLLGVLALRPVEPHGFLIVLHPIFLRHGGPRHP